MSDSISATDVPDDIGRNDPCPCGSGRKYKKCHQRAHELEKQSTKKSRAPQDLIDDDTIPWKVFNILQQVEDNGAIGLFWALAHDQGPFRERYPGKSDFIAAVDSGEEGLPAGPAYELMHMRVDGPDTYLVIREDDPKQDDVRYQIVGLRRNELDVDGQQRSVDHSGFRIWDYHRHQIDRDEYDGVPPMEAFGVDWK